MEETIAWDVAGFTFTEWINSLLVRHANNPGTKCLPHGRKMNSDAPSGTQDLRKILPCWKDPSGRDRLLSAVVNTALFLLRPHVFN
jgi:hypothetical protein